MSQVTARSQVNVEIIRVPSKRDKRLAAIADSARQANEIAKAHNEKTRKNREKYARSNPTR